MLGRDGVCEHEALYEQNADAAGELLAAPGAGFYICVFKVLVTVATSGVVALEDGGASRRWAAYIAAGRVGTDYDQCGLFKLPENSSLNFVGTAGVMARYNITYEIRPIGM